MTDGADHPGTATQAEHDVVWAAYTAATENAGLTVPVGAPVGRATGCARCGHTTAVMSPVGQVISRRFTGFESWTNLSGRRLCEVCVWGYRHRKLRADPHIVTREPATFRPASPALLRQVLSATVDVNTAVIVPLRPGRKHLIPDARWGLVTVDDTQLNWTEDDAGRLTVLLRLRGHGFTETMLREATPTYAVLRRIPPDQWPQVFDDWNRLTPWRHAEPWFDVAIRATR